MYELWPRLHLFYRKTKKNGGPSVFDVKGKRKMIPRRPIHNSFFSRALFSLTHVTLFLYGSWQLAMIVEIFVNFGWIFNKNRVFEHYVPNSVQIQRISDV